MEFLKNSYLGLAEAELSAEEAALRSAVQAKMAKGGAQAEAAQKILQGYEATKKAIGNVDFSKEGMGASDKDSSKSKDKEKSKEEILKEKAEKKKAELEEELQKKTMNWAEILLNKLQKTVDKWTKSAEKMFTFWNKNWAINNSISSINESISSNIQAYKLYSDYAKKAAKKAGMSVVANEEKGTANYTGGYSLNSKYINLIKNGAMRIDEVNPTLYEKIQAYQEWYDKAQEVLNTIEELYEKEKELIKQKYTNILDYYNTLDSYYQSIAGVVDSQISVKNAAGQRTTMADYLRQFATYYDLYQNQSKGTLMAQLGATNGEITVDEATIALKKASGTKIGENKWYQDILSRAEDALSQNSILRGIQAKITDLIFDKKIADSTSERKEIASEIKDLKSDLRSNRLTRDERRSVKVNQPVVDLVSGNAEGFKSYQKTWAKVQNQLAKNNPSLKKLDKLYEVLDSIEYAVDTVSNIVGDAEVMQSATFQRMVDELANMIQKGGSGMSAKKQAQIEFKADEIAAIAKYATASNVDIYKSVYEGLYKLDQKEQKKGNLNAKDQATRERLEDMESELAKEREQYDAQMQRQLEIAQSLADPGNVKSLESGKKAMQDELKSLYDAKEQEYKEGIKTSQTYVSLLNKNKNGKYNDVLQGLLDYGSSDMTEDEAKTLADALKLKNDVESKNKKRTDKYWNAISTINAFRQRRETAVQELYKERADAIRQALIEYDQMINESIEKQNEYLAKMYEIAKTVVEVGLNDVKDAIATLDTFISYNQELLDLYDRFDPQLLRTIYGLDFIDKGVSQLDLLKNTYENTLTQMSNKLEQTKLLSEGYKELIEIAGENPDDWNRVFSQFMESDAYKNSAEMQANVANMIQLLSQNDYSASTWVAEWQESMNDANIEILQCVENIEDLKDALRENVVFKAISNAIEAIDSLQGRLSSMSGYILEDWYYDSNGLTDFGRAQVKQLNDQMQASLETAMKYQEKMQKILADEDDTYGADPDKQIEEYNEAYQNYLDALNEGEDYWKEIYEISKQVQEKEVSLLEEKISKWKELYDKQRSYYEYDKNVRQQQSDIDALESQIRALRGINTAEAKAQLKQLEAQRDEAQKQLDETKKEHENEITQAALDDLVSDLKSSIEDSADDVITTIKEMSEAVTDIISNSLGVDIDAIRQIITDYVYVGSGHQNQPYADIQTLLEKQVGIETKINDALADFQAQEKDKEAEVNNYQTTVDKYKDRYDLTPESYASSVQSTKDSYQSQIDALNSKLDVGSIVSGFRTQTMRVRDSNLKTYYSGVASLISKYGTTDNKDSIINALRGFSSLGLSGRDYSRAESIIKSQFGNDRANIQNQIDSLKSQQSEAVSAVPTVLSDEERDIYEDAVSNLANANGELSAIQETLAQIREDIDNKVWKTAGYEFEGYATGTNHAKRGWKLVGEEGPELMFMNGGERVLDASETLSVADAINSGLYTLASTSSNSALTPVNKTIASMSSNASGWMGSLGETTASINMLVSNIESSNKEYYASVVSNLNNINQKLNTLSNIDDTLSNIKNNTDNIVPITSIANSNNTSIFNQLKLAGISLSY